MPYFKIKKEIEDRFEHKKLKIILFETNKNSVEIED